MKPAGDNIALAILLTLTFCLLAPTADAMAKHLGAVMSVFALVFIRFVAQAAILWPLAKALGEPVHVPRDLRALVWARVILHIAGIALMFTALQFLPLADALAIAYVMPFIAMALGALFLGEQVGPIRILIAGFGFLGTLLVIQPNFAQTGAMALLPLGVAVVFAGFFIVTRKIAAEIAPIALQALNGAMGVLLLLPALGLGLLLDWPALQIHWSADVSWSFVALFAITGTFAHLAMSWSLRYAPAATLAPISYLEIPVAAGLGYWAFSDLPNGLALIGIIITVLAGLILIWRERAIAQRQEAQP
ncbi:MAG: DMT family transporter [Pseudomonadota bacterium]